MKRGLLLLILLVSCKAPHINDYQYAPPPKLEIITLPFYIEQRTGLCDYYWYDTVIIAESRDFFCLGFKSTKWSKCYDKVNTGNSKGIAVKDTETKDVIHIMGYSGSHVVVLNVVNVTGHPSWYMVSKKPCLPKL